MGGLIPLSDASRRPLRFPVITAGIIVANFLVFILELNGGDAFVLKWAAIPANITSGHRWMLAQVTVNPHSTVPKLGASGAIAAVMGAFLVT